VGSGISIRPWRAGVEGAVTTLCTKNDYWEFSIVRFEPSHAFAKKDGPPIRTRTLRDRITGCQNGARKVVDSRKATTASWISWIANDNAKYQGAAPTGLRCGMGAARR
jgi:hypothetical protein